MIKTLMIKLQMSGNLEILSVKTNGVSRRPNKTIFLQEKKPLGKQSKNSQPQNSLIYPAASQERRVVERFSHSSRGSSGARYSGLSSHGYSNGGSVYYPGQRHPDMLPGDEAL